MTYCGGGIAASFDALALATVGIDAALYGIIEVSPDVVVEVDVDEHPARDRDAVQRPVGVVLGGCADDARMVLDASAGRRNHSGNEPSYEGAQVAHLPNCPMSQVASTSEP